MIYKNKSKSKLIIGPMFANKSTKLIGIIEYFAKKNKRFKVFKPTFDNRKSKNYIVCHNNQIYPVILIEDLEQILLKIGKIKNLDAVFFSEVQFFDKNFIYVVKKLLDKKISLYFAGLSLDFKRDTFDVIEDLKKIVDKIEYRFAGCYKCFKKAPFSKRIVSSRKKFLIGGKNFYVPTCEACYN